MNCPNCGAAMRTDNGIYKCDYCHNVVVPEKDDDGISVSGEAEPGGEQCPICNVPLMKASLGELPLLVCTRCDGMLVSMQEFEDVISASRAARPGATVRRTPANPDDLRRRINCPHCHRPMEAHFYGGPGDVILDSCENCSLNWLDHGELARIAHARPSDFADSGSDADLGAALPEDSSGFLSQSA